MMYLFLVMLAIPAWQDFKRKEIKQITLIMLWGVVIGIIAINYGNGTENSLENIIKLGATILISMLTIYYGKDKYLGRGDILVVAWLYAALSFDFFLKVLTFCMLILWIGAISCKFYFKKKCLPLLPFLWWGYVLALLI